MTLTIDNPQDLRTAVDWLTSQLGRRHCAGAPCLTAFHGRICRRWWRSRPRWKIRLVFDTDPAVLAAGARLHAEARPATLDDYKKN